MPHLTAKLRQIDSLPLLKCLLSMRERRIPRRQQKLGSTATGLAATSKSLDFLLQEVGELSHVAEHKLITVVLLGC